MGTLRLDGRGTTGESPNWQAVWLNLRLAEEPCRRLLGRHGKNATRSAAEGRVTPSEKVIGSDEGERARYARHYAEIYRMHENLEQTKSATGP